jgi:hypothetical protein
VPFKGVDLWRWQYFEGVACPDAITIPVDDPTAWQLYPRYRHVYSKLFICESQGIPNGPHGVMPAAYPVFSKPSTNLHGMGIGSRVIRSAAEMEASFTPGHMWMPMLRGPHVSTDVAVVRGRARWCRHATGYALPCGMFDYWTLHARPRPRLGGYLGRWIQRYLPGFTGIANIETIGGKIIEAHLRMGSEQWVDLNGSGWLERVVRLYTAGRWQFDARPRTGYSVALFGRHGVAYAIDPDAVDELRRIAGVSSIQITFDRNRPWEQHAMPPGGFRLAIVNCWDLAVGCLVRRRLTTLFRSPPEHAASRPAVLETWGAVGGDLAARLNGRPPHAGGRVDRGAPLRGAAAEGSVPRASGR